MFKYSLLPEAEGEKAYEWYTQQCEGLEVIFPRSWLEFQAAMDVGHTWCAKDEDGELASLTLVSVEESAHPVAWELGALIVRPEYRRSGVALNVAGFALVDVLHVETPTYRGQPIIFRVHEDNIWLGEAAQSKLNFERKPGDLRIAAKDAPGMRVADGGDVIGYEYQLSCPETVIALRNWLLSIRGIEDDIAADLPANANFDDWLTTLNDLIRDFP